MGDRRRRHVVLTACVTGVILLTGCSDSGGDQESRAGGATSVTSPEDRRAGTVDEAVDRLVVGGVLPRDRADCLADRLDDSLGEDETLAILDGGSPPRPDQFPAMERAANECLGGGDVANILLAGLPEDARRKATECLAEQLEGKAGTAQVELAEAQLEGTPMGDSSVVGPALDACIGEEPMAAILGAGVDQILPDASEEQRSCARDALAGEVRFTEVLDQQHGGPEAQAAFADRVKAAGAACGVS